MLSAISGKESRELHPPQVAGLVPEQEQEQAVELVVDRAVEWAVREVVVLVVERAEVMAVELPVVAAAELLVVLDLAAGVWPPRPLHLPFQWMASV